MLLPLAFYFLMKLHCRLLNHAKPSAKNFIFQASCTTSKRLIILYHKDMCWKFSQTQQQLEKYHGLNNKRALLTLLQTTNQLSRPELNYSNTKETIKVIFEDFTKYLERWWKGCRLHLSFQVKFHSFFLQSKEKQNERFAYDFSSYRFNRGIMFKTIFYFLSFLFFFTQQEVRTLSALKKKKSQEAHRVNLIIFYVLWPRVN